VFEDCKGATKIRISKNRQHNDQKKKVQKEKQQSTKHKHTSKGRVAWILPFWSIHEFINLKIYIDVGLRFHLLKKM
jgi:hypothetical protein